MERKTKIIMLVMILLGSTPFVYSQTDSLPSDELEVMKRFRASMGKTQRLRATPSPPELDTASGEYTYDFKIFGIETPESKAEFQYNELTLDDLYDPFHGVVKLGYGIPNQPFGLISLGQNTPASHQWNAYVQHHQYGREGAFQDFSSTNGQLNGSIRLDEDWAISGDLGVSHRRHQYFPLRDDTLYEESDVDRTLLSVSPGIAIQGYTGLWHHQGHFRYNFNKDDEGPKQHDANLSVSSQRSWNDRNSFKISLTGQVGQITQDTFENSLDYASLAASWDHAWRRWSSRLGFSTVAGNTSMIFPDIQVGFILDDQSAHLRAYATGKGQPLSLRRVFSENPFLDPTSEINVMQGVYDFGLALSGRMGGLHYEVTGAFQRRQNQHLFINDSIAQHLFDLVIDDVDQWRLSADLELEMGDHSLVGINVEKMFLDAKNQEKPYHLPTYNLFIFTTHQLLSESLLIKPSLRMTGGMSFVEKNTIKTLEPVVDLSLNIRFRFNAYWSLFLEGSNLLNQKNQRYFGYDSIGSMLLSGIMYKL